MAAMAAMDRCERARDAGRRKSASYSHLPIEPELGKEVGRESDLHDQVIDECRRRGYYIVHSRTDKRSTNGIGTPDFIIALPSSKTLWLEIKKKGGKMTTEQLAAQAWLNRLEHRAFTAWSFNEFLGILKDMDV